MTTQKLNKPSPVLLGFPFKPLPHYRNWFLQSSPRPFDFVQTTRNSTSILLTVSVAKTSDNSTAVVATFFITIKSRLLYEKKTFKKRQLGCKKKYQIHLTFSEKQNYIHKFNHLCRVINATTKLFLMNPTMGKIILHLMRWHVWFSIFMITTPEIRTFIRLTRILIH